MSLNLKEKSKAVNFLFGFWTTELSFLPSELSGPGAECSCSCGRRSPAARRCPPALLNHRGRTESAPSLVPPAWICPERCRHGDGSNGHDGVVRGLWLEHLQDCQCHRPAAQTWWWWPGCRGRLRLTKPGSPLLGAGNTNEWVLSTEVRFLLQYKWHRTSKFFPLRCETASHLKGLKGCWENIKNSQILYCFQGKATCCRVK